MSEKPLIRKAPAGWRRGYAADCKSAPGNPHIPFIRKQIPPFGGFDNPPGQIGNVSGNLTTEATA